MGEHIEIHESKSQRKWKQTHSVQIATEQKPIRHSYNPNIAESHGTQKGNPMQSQKAKESKNKANGNTYDPSGNPLETHMAQLGIKNRTPLDPIRSQIESSGIQKEIQWNPIGTRSKFCYLRSFAQNPNFCYLRSFPKI